MNNNYKFKDLPIAARKHVRLFQTHEFFNWGAMGIIMVVLVLLLQERGYNLFDISILMGMFSATALVFELPLGGLADGIGRKPVFIFSLIANISGILVLLFFQTYTSTAIGFALFGLGRALMSGTMDAWYIETFKKLAPKFGSVSILAKVQFSGATGLAIGAMLGGFMADYFGPKLIAYGMGIYDAPLIGNLLVTIFVLVFNLALIKEDHQPLNRQAIKSGFTNVPLVIKDSFHYALYHNIISILLVSIGLLSMALFALETFWIPFAKPMIDSQYAVSIIGGISVVYFGSMAIGTVFSEPVVNLFKGHNAKALIFFTVLSGLFFIGLSLTSNIYIFVLILFFLNSILGAQGAPADSLFHDYVPDDKRSTLLSLQSVIGQLGGLVGVLCLGFIAEKYSISTAWQIGGIIVIITALILLILPKRMAATPVVEHDDKSDDEN